MIDGRKHKIYDHRADSNVKFLTDFLEAMTHRYGIGFIDLHEPMTLDYEEHGIRFNPIYDGHWDEYGHELVARIVAENLTK